MCNSFQKWKKLKSLVNRFEKKYLDGRKSKKTSLGEERPSHYATTYTETILSTVRGKSASGLSQARSLKSHLPILVTPTHTLYTPVIHVCGERKKEKKIQISGELFVGAS